MKNAKKVIAAGAAGLVLAATGGLPALAAPSTSTPSSLASSPVGSVFSGTVEATSEGGFLVERRQKRGNVVLVAVDTDAATVASREGLAIALTSVPAGSSVIVSGTKNRDGSILASKIIVRKS